VAVKRGKSQARRNSGNGGGLPGWAWLILGIVIALVVVLAAPKLLKSDGDGFIRPRPNPDAQPVASKGDDDTVVPDNADADGAKPANVAAKQDDKEPQYDFYTLLPGQEVAMSDAELAASADAEEARKRKLAEQQQKPSPDTQPVASPASGALPANAHAATGVAPAVASPAATASTATDTQAHYILQAGAFGASGDAEALKARIALLGLNARVESAAISGKTVYRVRMGPYGTAIELANAKGKLANGGLPAMAIKAR
jgi:cell division protein FtsN